MKILAVKDVEHKNIKLWSNEPMNSLPESIMEADSGAVFTMAADDLLMVGATAISSDKFEAMVLCITEICKKLYNTEPIYA